MELTRPHTPNVPRVLPQDYENYALSFYFNSYLLPSTLPNHQRGFLGYVYPVWTRASHLSPLRVAVNAVAQALLEAWSFINPNSALSLARSHYAQGIVAVRRHLQNAKDIDDDILLATLMLDMYDGIMSFCGARPHKGPHVRGSAALIENRRGLHVNSTTFQGTLLAVRSRIVGDALNKGESVPINVLTWATSTQTSPRTPEIELEAINVELANLQVSASGLQTYSPETAPSASKLLAQAIELDQRLVGWTATIPDEWIPTCIWDDIPWSVHDAGLYQNHCTIHHSIWTAETLNGHCCSRIKLQLVTLACLDHLILPMSEIMRVNAHTAIQDSADAICASVPYHLGDRIEPRRIDDKTVQYPRIGERATPDEHYLTAAAYGGMFLTKRFMELLKLGPILRAGQQQWILGQVERIKSIYLAKPTCDNS
ncbi:MAG: hypothetical protein Q9211_000911 [Gyalolechia sp. 1 TL-2023]